jgi:hypothetical protein
MQFVHHGGEGTAEELQGWFAGRIPAEWFTGGPEVTADGFEILIVGTIPDVEGVAESGLEAAREGRIRQFREDTREARIKIAREAERRFRRKVSWGVRIADQEELFTTASVPIMTRLRMPDRQILDTLVEAGVARSRSHALAWCVRLVAQNESDWISKLKEALGAVQAARAQGPGSGTGVSSV